MAKAKKPKEDKGNVHIGRPLGLNQAYNIDLLYEIYMMCKGNVSKTVEYVHEKRFANVPLNKVTISKLIRENRFAERAAIDERKRTDADLKASALEKRKILTIVDNAMIKYAQNIAKGDGPKSAQEFRALFEVHQILIGEPTSIAQNTNMNTDVIAYFSRISNDPTDVSPKGEDVKPEEPTKGIGVLSTSGPRTDTE